MIAVDVMGGDKAPDVVLEGALAAAKKWVPVTLYGPQAMIHQWLNVHDRQWQNYPISISDAHDVIAMDDEPVSAVRKKSSSSLVKAVATVADGTSSAVISAGNSGALMAAAAFIIGRQAGVERPAIAGFMPTQNKPALVLDLGANTECRAHHLQQFAHLGCEYLAPMFRGDKPRIGLLSNGHEEGKGPMKIKEAYALLKQDTLNFIGNVEPYGVFTGKADVVVCDGFAGNVLLKTMEAVIELVTHTMKMTSKSAVEAMPSIAQTGALLLGVKGSVVVCHGNSSAEAIENAIVYAWKISNRK